MAFDNAPFPLTPRTERVSPAWRTTIVQAGGGAEVRNQWHSDPLRRYELDCGVITLAAFRVWEKHFHARRGMTRAFPYLSKSAFQATAETVSGTVNGSNTVFQLALTEGDASNAYTREIYKPLSGTLTVYDNASARTEGVHFTADYSTGVITFVTAPASGHVITATFQFYVPVRYDFDAIDDAELFIFVSGGQQLVRVSGVSLMETRDIA